MKTKYLRLLSYPNAMKIVDFINSNDKKDYAHITPGGVRMEVSEENWEKVEKEIKSLGVRYEVGEEHPTEVVKKIVKDLKEKGVI